MADLARRRGHRHGQGHKHEEGTPQHRGPQLPTHQTENAMAGGWRGRGLGDGGWWLVDGRLGGWLARWAARLRRRGLRAVAVRRVGSSTVLWGCHSGTARPYLPLARAAAVHSTIVAATAHSKLL